MQSAQKMSLPMLTAMVVGSMVGAGIFSLPRTFGAATGPIGALIAWAVAGGGMYMLARVFRALAERKPDLDAGVFACASAGLATVPVSVRVRLLGRGCCRALIGSSIAPLLLRQGNPTAGRSPDVD